MSKICRFCWKIISDDDDFCDNGHVDCRVFFDSVTDMIDTLVNPNAKSALKLQESLKEWIEETKQPLPEGHISIVSLHGVRMKLQSLVEESEK